MTKQSANPSRLARPLTTLAAAAALAAVLSSPVAAQAGHDTTTPAISALSSLEAQIAELKKQVDQLTRRHGAKPTANPAGGETEKPWPHAYWEKQSLYGN